MSASLPAEELPPTSPMKDPQRRVRRGLSKAELVDTACALLWEYASRTCCRPGDFEDQRKKSDLIDMECSANGFDRKDIFEAAMDEMRAPIVAVNSVSTQDVTGRIARAVADELRGRREMDAAEVLAEMRRLRNDELPMPLTGLVNLPISNLDNFWPETPATASGTTDETTK